MWAGAQKTYVGRRMPMPYALVGKGAMLLPYALCMWAGAQCLMPYALRLMYVGRRTKNVCTSQRKSMPYALCLMPALSVRMCGAGAQNMRAQGNLFH